MHLTPTNGIRGYTNKVRLSCGTLRERGLTENQGFGTRVGGFCLCSRNFSRLVQDMRGLIAMPSGKADANAL
ncbi:hypothetical protein WKK05_23860 [Nostoc sp. UHCC 0302]|uniref:hypothetical protein n=1 Tax=Nostoc sp. UHCC 0302 TaxID=3134896 RepID=UPI00311C9FF2